MTTSPLPAGSDVGDSPGGKFQSRTGIFDAAGNDIGANLLARLTSLVAGLSVAQPVSATALPLPAGAATETKLEAVRALLAGTLGITATALPLPAGAATEVKLEAARVLLAAIQAATDAMQPARNDFAITPSDATAITPLPRAVRVNVAGTVVYRAVDSTADVTINAAAGETIQSRVQYIRATGTSATGFVGKA